MGQIKNIKLHIVTDIKETPLLNMIIPKKNRVAIYESLFKDGVMVAIKDFNLKKHNELEKVGNLEVIKAMQSLKSRGYVRETEMLTDVKVVVVMRAWTSKWWIWCSSTSQHGRIWCPTKLNLT